MIAKSILSSSVLVLLTVLGVAVSARAEPARPPARAESASDAIPMEADDEQRAATGMGAANLARRLAELEKEMAF